MDFYSTRLVAKECNLSLQTATEWAKYNLENKLHGSGTKKEAFLWTVEDIEKFKNRDVKRGRPKMKNAE